MPSFWEIHFPLFGAAESAPDLSPLVHLTVSDLASVLSTLVRLKIRHVKCLVWTRLKQCQLSPSATSHSCLVQTSRPISDSVLNTHLFFSEASVFLFVQSFSEVNKLKWDKMDSKLDVHETPSTSKT